MSIIHRPISGTAYKIECTPRDDGMEVVVRFQSLPNGDGWAALHKEIQRLLDQNYLLWRFDLTDLDFCDSTGLGMWITMNATIRNRRGRLQYDLRKDSRVAQLFLLTKLDSILNTTTC